MTNLPKIYIDRLYNEKTEEIEEAFDPVFIDVNEKDLQFHTPVSVKGQAYLTKNHLVIYVCIETTAEVACSICNKKIEKKIAITRLYHTEDLANIRGHIYDYTNPLREAVLLEIPSYAECLENCPERTKLKNSLYGGVDQLPFKDLN